MSCFLSIWDTEVRSTSMPPLVARHVSRPPFFCCTLLISHVQLQSQYSITLCIYLHYLFTILTGSLKSIVHVRSQCIFHCIKFKDNPSVHQAQVWSVRVSVCVCVFVCVYVCVRVCFCVRGVHAWVWMSVLPSYPPAQVWQRRSVCLLRATAAEFKLQQPGRDAETEPTEGLQYHTPTPQGRWESSFVCIARMMRALTLSYIKNSVLNEVDCVQTAGKFD